MRPGVRRMKSAPQTRQSQGLRGVDALDAGVRDVAALELRMQHPRQLEIARVLRRAGDLAQNVRAPDGSADDRRLAHAESSFAAAWIA